MFWYFGHKECGTLARQSGIKHAPLALEGKVLTTGPQGSPWFNILTQNSKMGPVLKAVSLKWNYE